MALGVSSFRLGLSVPTSCGAGKQSVAKLNALCLMSCRCSRRHALGTRVSSLVARACRCAPLEDRCAHDLVCWSADGSMCVPRPCHVLTAGAPPPGAV